MISVIGNEIRIESANKDDSHSWVSIFYGTVKELLVNNLEDSMLCKNIFNRFNDFHLKIDWVNSVRKQDL